MGAFHPTKNTRTFKKGAEVRKNFYKGLGKIQKVFDYFSVLVNSLFKHYGLENIHHRFNDLKHVFTRTQFPQFHETNWS